MKLALLALAAASLMAARARACPGCSNPNLPVGGATAQATPPGGLDVAITATATSVHVVHDEACPEIGPICATRDEPPQLHDQRLSVGELRARLTYGLDRRWNLEAQLPVRATRSRIVFRRLDGTRFTPDYENIHHRDETIAGLADASLALRVSLELSRLWLGVSAGLSLPLGRTEEDPFALADQGRAHQHVQLGTGTFNPQLRAQAALPLGAARLGAYAQTELMLYENTHGFRAGHRYAAGASLSSPALGAFTFAGLADVVSEQPERWRGVVRQDGNLGRTDLLVGARLAMELGGARLALGARLPVVTHLMRGEAHDQLDYPAIVDAEIATTY